MWGSVKYDRAVDHLLREENLTKCEKCQNDTLCHFDTFNKFEENLTGNIIFSGVRKT